MLKKPGFWLPSRRSKKPGFSPNLVAGAKDVEKTRFLATGSWSTIALFDRTQHTT
ncbi:MULTISPECIES: hypothetical protein [unclassified Microcoleus]|uniref:hypothetical protein n=1 Tax=unclassified Microcoleus TaxID=2642155 RepID=UPI002FD1EF0F